MIKDQWFAVPVTIYEDNDHNPERIAAEVYLRMLAHYGRGTIKTSQRSIAKRLGWGRTRLQRFIEKLVQGGKIVRANVGPSTGHLTITPLVGYAGQAKNRVESAGPTHYIEKDIEENEIKKKRREKGARPKTDMEILKEYEAKQEKSGVSDD